MGFLGRDSEPPSYQLGGLGSATGPLATPLVGVSRIIRLDCMVKKLQCYTFALI